VPTAATGSSHRGDGAGLQGWQGRPGGAFVNSVQGSRWNLREVVCHLADLIDAREFRGRTPRSGEEGRWSQERACSPVRSFAPLRRDPLVPSPIARRNHPTESRSEQETASRPTRAAGRLRSWGRPQYLRSVAGRTCCPCHDSEAHFGDLSVSVDDHNLTGNCPGNQPGTSAEEPSSWSCISRPATRGNEAPDLPTEYELGRYCSGLGAGLPCRYNAEAFGNSCWKAGEALPLRTMRRLDSLRGTAGVRSIAVHRRVTARYPLKQVVADWSLSDSSEWAARPRPRLDSPRDLDRPAEQRMVRGG
jgi:hypothetical protein